MKKTLLSIFALISAYSAQGQYLPLNGLGTMSGTIFSSAVQVVHGWAANSYYSGADGYGNRVGYLQFQTGTVELSSEAGNRYISLNPNGGNVGIGMTNPLYKLDVNGAGRFLEGVMVPDGRPFGVVSTIGASWANNTLIYKGYTTSNGDYSEILVPGGLANTANIRLLQNGNVGIGTAVPDAKLAVNGLIHAKEVKIDLNGWPDYVFAPSYRLTSLKDIKSYINVNHHLPDVPSEKEMTEKGLHVGQMNAILLKKIEELTLLLIKQEERVDAQDQRISKQAAEIEKLKNK